MTTTNEDGPSPRPEVWEALDDVMSSVPAQADLLPKVVERVRPQAAALVRGGVTAVKRVYLVGCGDSFYAAYGVQQVFERLTGLDTVAMEAMEFARYKAPFIGPESLVVPVSNGGRVMRTVEAAEMASQAGSSVILVTGRPDSPFGRLGLPMVDQYVEPDDGSPSVNALGLVNYMASFISMVLIGEELGRVLGSSSDADRARIDSALAAAPELIQSSIDRHLPPLRQWAREHPLTSFFILGAGPSFGAAQFVGAKFFEAPQFAASVQQLEEWAHEQFFTHRPGRPVMILAPSGASAGRAAEILAGIQAVQGVGLVISDDPALLASADLALEIPASPAGEGMSPLHSVVPGQILAIAYQETAGRLEDRQPGLRELQHRVSRRQIGESVRVSLAELR